MALGSYLPPVKGGSWMDVQLGCSSASDWQGRVSSMHADYVSFLRKGIECEKCGAVLPQPVFVAVQPAVVAAASAAADCASITVDLDDDASPAGGAVAAGEIDLTEDDPDAPPPGLPPNPLAAVLICPHCASRYCAACGLAHEPAAVAPAAAETADAAVAPSAAATVAVSGFDTAIEPLAAAAVVVAPAAPAAAAAAVPAAAVAAVAAAAVPAAVVASAVDAAAADDDVIILDDDDGVAPVAAAAAPRGGKSGKKGGKAAARALSAKAAAAAAAKASRAAAAAAATAAAAAAEVLEDLDEAEVAPPLQPLPSVQVVASGQGGGGAAEKAHGAACPLRRVHALAMSMEQMRRAALGTLVAPPAPAAAGGAAGAKGGGKKGKGARGKPQAGAAHSGSTFSALLALAGHGGSSSVSASMQHMLMMAQSLGVAPSALGLAGGGLHSAAALAATAAESARISASAGEAVLAALVAQGLLTRGAASGLKAALAKDLAGLTASSAAAAGVPGYHNEDGDDEDEDDSDYYTFMGGHHSSTKSKPGGTGYGGGLDDARVVKQAELRRHAQRAVRDITAYAVVSAIRELLPADVFSRNGWAPVLVSTQTLTLADDEVEEAGGAGAGGAAAASSSSSSSSAAAAAAAAAASLCRVPPTMELVTGTVTDRASDHPLLLQMLVSPGFGDGMPLTVATSAPSAMPPAAAAAAAVSSSAGRAGSAVPSAARAVTAAVADEADAINISCKSNDAAEEVAAPVTGAKRKRAAAVKPSAAARKKAASGAVPPASVKATPVRAAPAGAAAAAPAPAVLGAGDGLRGPSPLYGTLVELLRCSIMDVTKLEATRQLFFAALQLLQRLARHPQLAAFLLYTPDQAEALNPSPPTPTKAAAAAAASSSRGASSSDIVGAGAMPPYRAWVHPLHAFTPGTGALAPAAASLAQLLATLRKQADVFVKSSARMSGASEVLMGSSEEEEKFTSVLCLSRDLEVAADTVTVNVLSWAGTHAALVGRLGDDDEEAAEVGGGGAGGGLAKRARIESSSSSSYSRAGAKAAPAPKRTSANVSEAEMVALARAAARSGGTDPILAFSIGAAPVAYEPPAATVSAYEALLREEAYDTVEGLKTGHYYNKGGGAGGGAASAAGGSSMIRHMRVASEMANLPTLAVNFASSVLVRQDEAAIDYMRALMTGPADTPYANGVFLFDMYLPPSYPQVSPSVMFLTTGGGMARFNPNLYAEGKVCLSLLGTWQGPGWDPAISTLSQVLIAIQAQIMNSTPFYNEPSYEQYEGTDHGRRAVAKHNTQIRLATLRYALLEPLRRPPPHFERAVRAHFYYKRDELARQCAQWVAEAKAVAAYESTLKAAVDTAKASYAASLTAEVAAFNASAAAREAGRSHAERAREAAAAAAAKEAADAKAAKQPGSYQYYAAKYTSDPVKYAPFKSYVALAASQSSDGGSGRGTFDSVTGQMLPAGFSLSAALKRTATACTSATAPYSNWISQTAISGHQVFARGIGGLPRASTAAYAPEAAASAGVGSAAASSSSMYAAAAPAAYYHASSAGAAADSVGIAAATDAAAQELLAVLSTLKAPE